jgi:hypothetical protein
MPVEHTAGLLDLLSGISFVVFFCAKHVMYEVIEGRVIPDWKKFISSGENKQSLIRFLGDYIVKHINQNNSLQEVQSLTFLQ